MFDHLKENTTEQQKLLKYRKYRGVSISKGQELDPNIKYNSHKELQDITIHPMCSNKWEKTSRYDSS